MYTKCTGRHGRKFDYLVCTGRRREKSCDLPYLPVERVEDFVTTYYETHITVDAERVAALEPKLIEQYRRVAVSRQDDVERQQHKVDAIRAKRQQLVDSHLANPRAVPLDVLEVKQADLDEQLKATEAELGRAAGDVEEAEKGIVRVKLLLSRSSATYRKATPLFRRQINQAFFAKVFVGLEGVTGSQPTDELAMVLREDLAARLQELSGRPRLHFGRGSTESLLVEDQAPLAGSTGSEDSRVNSGGRRSLTGGSRP